MFHLLGFYRQVDNSAPNTEVTPIPDGVIPTNPATNRFLVSSKSYLLGAYAGASSLARARVFTPWGIPSSIRPINLTIQAAALPPVADWRRYPPILPAGQDLIVDATHTAGAPVDVVALVWMAVAVDLRSPVGDRIVLRADMSGAAQTAFRWSPVAVTWESELPPGTYAVTGSWFYSSNGIAHRWILEGIRMRPGGLSAKVVGDWENRFSYGPTLGEWGRFRAPVMPRLELICSATNATGTAFLEVVRVA